MTDSSGSELPMDCCQETLQLNKELERMIETMENMSVQLSWMAYDMVVLRTDPQNAQAIRRLQDVHLLYASCRCVCSSDGVYEALQQLLTRLDSTSAQLDHLIVQVELLLCDVSVCFTHPEVWKLLRPEEMADHDAPHL